MPEKGTKRKGHLETRGEERSNQVNPSERARRTVHKTKCQQVRDDEEELTLGLPTNEPSLHGSLVVSLEQGTTETR